MINFDSLYIRKKTVILPSCSVFPNMNDNFLYIINDTVPTVYLEFKMKLLKCVFKVLHKTFSKTYVCV